MSICKSFRPHVLSPDIFCEFPLNFVLGVDLRVTFAPNREEVRGSWRKLHN
jgi:hypothetical protein